MHKESCSYGAGFSPYISHVLLRRGMQTDILARIVALEKVTGSSPVGHPLTQVATQRTSVFSKGQLNTFRHSGERRAQRRRHCYSVPKVKQGGHHGGG